MLKGNLKDDRKRYTGPASGPTQLPTKILLPEWQKDHAKAVKDMLAYVVDTTAEDEPEDDEGGDEGSNGHNGRRDVEMEDREYIDDDGDGIGSAPTHVQVNTAARDPPPGGNEQSARIGRK